MKPCRDGSITVGDEQEMVMTEKEQQRESEILKEIDRLYDVMNDPDDDTPLTIIEEDIEHYKEELKEIRGLDDGD